jgi:ribosomal protein L17
MLRDLTTDLLINESIVTQEARAKEIRKTVEKMITLGNAVIFMLVVKQLLSYVMKLHLKTLMKLLKNTLHKQLFKNFS